MKKKIATLVFAVCAVFSLPAFANVSIDQFSEFRSRFQKGMIPIPADLDKSVWTCDTVAVSQPGVAFNEKFYDFFLVDHNRNLIFSNDSTVSQWIPRWYVAYQGLRSSMPYETNDFLAECGNDVHSCIKEGTGITGYSYLRWNRLGELLVEWTAMSYPGSADLKFDAISRDSDVEGQKAVMYSVCHGRHHSAFSGRV